MTSANSKMPCRPSVGIPSKDIISPPKTTTQLTTPQLSKQQKLFHFQNPAKDMSLLRTIAIKAPRAPLAATTKRVRFSTSLYARKDSGSAVKETVESVNKQVGDAAVKGIEKGREFIPLRVLDLAITTTSYFTLYHFTCTCTRQPTTYRIHYFF